MACQFKTRTIPLCQGEDERAEGLRVLAREMDFIAPKKHRYFCKQYKLESSLHEIPLLLRDIEDYHLLITNQSKSNAVFISEIVSFLQEYQLEGQLSQLVTGILQYFDDFTCRNLQSLRRLGRRHL